MKLFSRPKKIINSPTAHNGAVEKHQINTIRVFTRNIWSIVEVFDAIYPRSKGSGEPGMVQDF
jgi:hypothetical protein